MPSTPVRAKTVFHETRHRCLKGGDRWLRKHVTHSGDPAQRPGVTRSGAGLGVPHSCPCPPPPPGMLPRSQLLGLLTGVCPSITGAHTRTHTCKCCDVENTPRGRTTLQTGHSASSPLAEPQVRPIHHKTSVSCENALESRLLQPWTLTLLGLTKPAHTSQIKPRSGAATSRGPAGLYLRLAAHQALRPCKRP